MLNKMRVVVPHPSRLYLLDECFGNSIIHVTLTFKSAVVYTTRLMQSRLRFPRHSSISYSLVGRITGCTHLTFTPTNICEVCIDPEVYVPHMFLLSKLSLSCTQDVITEVTQAAYQVPV